jgi:DNA-binding beta-propeller fold protein YncE
MHLDMSNWFGSDSALCRTAAAALMGVVLTAAPVAAQNAHWYLGTYSHDILVWDEASEEIIDRIQVENFIPMNLFLSQDQDRLYVMDATAEHIEVVDVDAGEVVDAFTLSAGNTTVRISGYTVSPDHDKAIVMVKTYQKQRDRYVVEGPFIWEYDLNSKQVTDTIDFPDGKQRENVGFTYSPDGETLYLFTDDIIAVNAETYEEVDRWELSKPLEPGMGRASFGTGSGTYDESGVATSLYRMTDPAQNRRMMGVAQVRLSEKEVDFFTVGDSRSMRGFALAPDGRYAYSLLNTVGRYEFWEFDLENQSLVRSVEFDGRPRMGVRVSADGEKLYIYVAGNTIDIYDRATFEYMRSVTFDEDMTGVVVIPQGGGE